VSGIGQFGVALAGSAAAFASLVAVSDAFTTFILVKGLSSANFDEAFSHTGFSDATANAVKGGALALMSLFGVIPIGLGFAFENVMRAATIYLLLAVIPITAAGLLSGNTSSWYWKTSHWMMAAIAMKPVMALALALGVGIAGGGQGLAAVIVGLAVLFVALFAPLALFRLFAFSSEKATDAVKGGWNASGGSDAVSGATDKVTSMASGSQTTSSMESSTDARYSGASNSTDTAPGMQDSGSPKSSSGGREMVNIAEGTPGGWSGDDHQNEDQQSTDTDRQHQAPSNDGEQPDAPGQPGTPPQQTPDASAHGGQQPPTEGAGAPQEQMPSPTVPGGGGGDHAPVSGSATPAAPATSRGTGGGTGDGAPAPSAATSTPGGGQAEQAPGGGGGAGGWRRGGDRCGGGRRGVIAAQHRVAGIDDFAPVAQRSWGHDAGGQGNDSSVGVPEGTPRMGVRALGGTTRRVYRGLGAGRGGDERPEIPVRPGMVARRGAHRPADDGPDQRAGRGDVADPLGAPHHRHRHGLVRVAVAGRDRATRDPGQPGRARSPDPVSAPRRSPAGRARTDMPDP